MSDSKFATDRPKFEADFTAGQHKAKAKCDAALPHLTDVIRYAICAEDAARQGHVGSMCIFFGELELAFRHAQEAINEARKALQE